MLNFGKKTLAGAALGAASVAAGAIVVATKELHKKAGKGNGKINKEYINSQRRGKIFNDAVDEQDFLKSFNADLHYKYLDHYPSEYSHQSEIDELSQQAIRVFDHKMNELVDNPSLAKKLHLMGDHELFTDYRKIVFGDTSSLATVSKDIFGRSNKEIEEKMDGIAVDSYLKLFKHNQTHGVLKVKYPAFVYSQPDFTGKHSAYKARKNSYVLIEDVIIIHKDNGDDVWYQTPFGFIPELAGPLMNLRGSNKFNKNIRKKLGRPLERVGEPLKQTR